jgi:hypothetical protein
MIRNVYFVTMKCPFPLFFLSERRKIVATIFEVEQRRPSNVLAFILQLMNGPPEKGRERKRVKERERESRERERERVEKERKRERE